MSHAFFHRGVSLLLRCPLPEREPRLLDLALQFELTTDERQSLESLASDEEFNRYGREQRVQRWQATSQKLAPLWSILDEGDVYHVWLYDFEPQYFHLQSDLSSCRAVASRTFIKFLREGVSRVKSPYDIDSFFLNDFLLFLDHQLELTQFVVDSPPIPITAVFATPHFRLLHLHYDMMSFMEFLDESAQLPEGHTEALVQAGETTARPSTQDRAGETEGTLHPITPLGRTGNKNREHEDLSHHISRRPQYLVMVREKPGMQPRIFEIDCDLHRELNQFLNCNQFSFNDAMIADLKLMGLLNDDIPGSC